jgi:hypothetical protein
VLLSALGTRLCVTIHRDTVPEQRCVGPAFSWPRPVRRC